MPNCPGAMTEQAVRRSAAEMAHVQSRASVARPLSHRAADAGLPGWTVPDEPRPRGRPPLPLDPLAIETVAEALDSHGRSIGLPALKQLFPSIPRSTLQQLRDQWSIDHEQGPCRLDWRTAAASLFRFDFTQTPLPVDGRPSRLRPGGARHRQPVYAPGRALPGAIRGSGCIPPFDKLRAGSCASCWCSCLYGPPQVLKTDNGSPFIAAATRAALFSPWRGQPAVCRRCRPGTMAASKPPLAERKTRAASPNNSPRHARRQSPAPRSAKLSWSLAFFSFGDLRVCSTEFNADLSRN